jgi:2-aminoethylphosphonate-pyruvate transaminase
MDQLTFVPAASETGDPLLLTPGPLTTSRRVKEAMLHDWGSRDPAFLEINRDVLKQLRGIIHGGDDFTTVPIQGSGTFAVEAMLTTLVPRGGTVLVLINGAYGHRAKQMCEIAQRRVVVQETAEDAPPDLAALAVALQRSPAITHVFAVHCEATSGILNPVAEIADVVVRHGRRLLVDGISAFGALPLDAREVAFDAVAASANKCLEGVPGLGFVICRKTALQAAAGNAGTLALDLHDQWRHLERAGEYRFTPPTHVIMALHQALREFFAEGGMAGRGARYASNCRVLRDGMRALGFQTLLPEPLQAPIIVTFPIPADPRFVFRDFYEKLKDRGFVIYPGKLRSAESFRIGCIGRIYPEHMAQAVVAIRDVLEEMGVSSLEPAPIA